MLSKLGILDGHLAKKGKVAVGIMRKHSNEAWTMSCWISRKPGRMPEHEDRGHAPLSAPPIRRGNQSLKYLATSGFTSSTIPYRPKTQMMMPVNTGERLRVLPMLIMLEATK